MSTPATDPTTRLRTTRQDEERNDWQQGTIVIIPNEVWAGMGRHSSLVELQIDGFEGHHDEVIRFLTPEAAEILGCQLLLAGLAGRLYAGTEPSSKGLISPDRLSTILQRVLVELDAEMDRDGEAT